MKEIKLTQGKVAIVDDEDYEDLVRYRWRAAYNGGRWYVKTAVKVDGKWRTISMHRTILKAEQDSNPVDHINGNGFDNRRSNLRQCTHSENLANSRRRSTKKYSSQYKGVAKLKQSRIKPWRAMICVNGKEIYLGTYKRELEAAIAYKIYSEKLRGEFACKDPIVKQSGLNRF